MQKLCKSYFMLTSLLFIQQLHDEEILHLFSSLLKSLDAEILQILLADNFANIHTTAA